MAGLRSYSCLFIGYLVQCFVTLLFTEFNPCHQVKVKFVAILGVALPSLQFFCSMLFANLQSTWDISQYLRLLTCFLYPLGIGLFKSLGDSNPKAELVDKNFETSALFELNSFLLAALPFRLLYFTLDSWLAVLEVFTIKFLYKLFTHALVPTWSLSIQQFKCKVTKKPVDPDKSFYVLGKGQPSDFNDFISGISAKFAFQQFNDILDIVSVALLVCLSFVVNIIQTKTGIAADISQDKLGTILLQCVVELWLEFQLTAAVLWLVTRKYLGDYKPMRVACS
jgi:hypothetical protein